MCRLGGGCHPQIAPEYSQDRALGNLELAVVVPTFNEIESIVRLIHAVQAALDEHAFEIIVVDDDSPDGTADEVRSVTGGRKPTDPMSGFFMIRTDVLRHLVSRLSAVGFKIPLDIFASALTRSGFGSFHILPAGTPRSACRAVEPSG